MSTETYKKFVSEYGKKSGVSFVTALHKSGLDLDTYQRVEAAGTIVGTIALKVWSKQGSYFWLYLNDNIGKKYTFPVYKDCAERTKSSEYYGLLHLPLETEIGVSFVLSKTGKTRIASAVVL